MDPQLLLLLLYTQGRPMVEVARFPLQEVRESCGAGQRGDRHPEVRVDTADVRVYLKAHLEEAPARSGPILPEVLA